MARLIELTDCVAYGNPVLVNMDLVTIIQSSDGWNRTAIGFGTDKHLTVSETLDEIAEKVRSLGVPVLRKGE